MSQWSKLLPVPLIAIVFLACSTVYLTLVHFWTSTSSPERSASGETSVMMLALIGLTEAIVICHQLGYTGASSYSRTSSDS